MQSRVYTVDEVRVETLIVIPENPPAMAVSARGTVLTTGWTAPVLAPRVYIVPPKDGILDLDFMAEAPTGFSAQVICPISVAMALPIPDWVIGVRVHSSTNAIEAKTSGREKGHKADLAAEGLPLPWPFPWWAPRAKTK